MKQSFRKPLVVMTPKSLLRHPKVVSGIEKMANGEFQTLIDDTLINAEKVERIALCSGKIYYELLAKREELNEERVALVRLEQLYPLDKQTLTGIMNRYAHNKEIVWVQEEPENMGAWAYILRNLRNIDIQVIVPVSSGTPAPGTYKGFDKNQKQVIQRVFDLENLISLRFR